MSPGDGRGRPGEGDLVNPAATDLKFTSTLTPPTEDSGPTHGELTLNPRTLAYVAQVNREIGAGVGFQAAMIAMRIGGEDMMTAARSFLAAHPRHASLEAVREPDHRPCPGRCRKCSKCIHALSYFERGGRPYLGIEAEAVTASSVTPVSDKLPRSTPDRSGHQSAPRSADTPGHRRQSRSQARHGADESMSRPLEADQSTTASQPDRGPRETPPRTGHRSTSADARCRSSSARSACISDSPRHDCSRDGRGASVDTP